MGTRDKEEVRTTKLIECYAITLQLHVPIWRCIIKTSLQADIHTLSLPPSLSLSLSHTHTHMQVQFYMHIIYMRVSPINFVYLRFSAISSCICFANCSRLLSFTNLTTSSLSLWFSYITGIIIP